MATETKTKSERPEHKELNISKDASVDFPVEVEALEADPYHVTGQKYNAGSKKAKELEGRGWVKILGKVAAMIALILMASFGAIEVKAQSSVLQDLYNTGTTHLLADFQTVTATSDTVTNTGSGALLSKRISGPGTVTIQVNVTKVSGTVGGTISLQGSLDGTNYKALNTEETQTALATITATDASNIYHWRLSKSPFIYYRVSWVGTGTMVATFTASILKH
jgi:hypothetical protein